MANALHTPQGRDEVVVRVLGEDIADETEKERSDSVDTDPVGVGQLWNSPSSAHPNDRRSR